MRSKTLCHADRARRPKPKPDGRILMAPPCHPRGRAVRGCASLFADDDRAPRSASDGIAGHRCRQNGLDRTVRDAHALDSRLVRAFLVTDDQVGWAPVVGSERNHVHVGPGVRAGGHDARVQMLGDGHQRCGVVFRGACAHALGRGGLERIDAEQLL